MRIPSNKIADIVRFFRDELKNIYESNEIEIFIGYCFEEYLGLKRADIVLNGSVPVNESELLKFNFAVKDLKQHKPIQYILGKADFYGLKFIVNSNVLIPRPETEELVHLIIKESKVSQSKAGEGAVSGIENSNLKILDIGTGSGCIAIALKKNIPDAQITAVDISVEAIKTAQQNAALNNTAVEFYQHDIFSSKEIGEGRGAGIYDVIVSNPPYIRLLEKEQMEKGVLDYEPHLALFVEDNDPLLFYKKIADFALKHLSKNGKLYFEINQAFGPEVKLLLENNGFENVQLLKDLNNNYRIIKANIK